MWPMIALLKFKYIRGGCDPWHDQISANYETQYRNSTSSSDGKSRANKGELGCCSVTKGGGVFSPKGLKFLIFLLFLAQNMVLQ